MSLPTPLPTLVQIASTLRVAAPTMVEGALGSLARDAVDARLRRWSADGVRATKMRLSVDGLEHVREGRTYVVMSNHLSNWDIIAIYRAFPGPTLRMVAKQEMRRLPIMGRAMEDAEFVFVDRRDSQRARDAIALAREKIEGGISVWIAPEGTRSKTGRLGPFKKGGFHLARATGATILPCTVAGTREISPPGSMSVRRGMPVRVTFHAPIDPARYDELAPLIEDVRASIASGLPPELRG